MSKPIALQLYTVRDLLNDEFEGIIRQIAAIGYAGVETAGLPDGVTPAQARSLFDELGLTVCSAHSPLPLGDDAARDLDTIATLGTDRLVNGYLPPEHYATLDETHRTCDRLNEAAAVAARHGLSLGVHNHWWEFEPLPDAPHRRPYEIWLERLDPAIFFELDLYWVQVGGADPHEALAVFGDRAQLLHVKDGPADSPEASMTAVGAGRIDYSTLLPTAAADWLIVELDRCDTDMLTAVGDSFDYLTAQGVGHGRR